jgi:hypothetical protein
MPSTSDILSGLTRISNDAFAAAVVWHALLAAALIAALLGWRPSRRALAIALSAPLLSVAAFAWAFGNPFNAAVFSALGLAAAAIGATLPRTPIERPAPGFALLGAALVAFAWLYPHFLSGRSPVAYFYGAPVGLIPCPTLSLVIGVALLCGGLGRPWAWLLSVAGLFYALFGALRLGVRIDLALLAGAIALALLAARGGGPGRPGEPRLAVDVA